jgi:hypothetical protein
MICEASDEFHSENRDCPEPKSKESRQQDVGSAKSLVKK